MNYDHLLATSYDICGVNITTSKGDTEYYFQSSKKYYGSYPMKYYFLILILLSGCGKIILRGPTPSQLQFKSSFEWVLDTSENFIYYVEEGSPGAMRLEYIKNVTESSMEPVLNILGIHDYNDQEIHVFIVDSRQRMKELIGWETNGTAFPSSYVMIMIVTDSWSSIGSHELFHVLVYHHWGKGRRWLNEGLAVFSDDKWHGHDLHSLANLLHENNRLVSINTLISNFNSVNDMISYPQAGSFAKFLFETYGRDAVKNIWINGDKVLEDVADLSLIEIEQKWHNHIQDFDYKGIDYTLN